MQTNEKKKGNIISHTEGLPTHINRKMTIIISRGGMMTSGIAKSVKSDILFYTQKFIMKQICSNLFGWCYNKDKGN